MSLNPVEATEANDLEPRELLDNRIEFLLSNLSFFLCFVLVAQQQHTLKKSRLYIFNFFLQGSDSQPGCRGTLGSRTKL